MSFHNRVPRDLSGNLSLRRRLVSLSDDNGDFQGGIREMCRRDILFWLNLFGWTYDPRRDSSTLPFVTWPFQDAALLSMAESLGSEDLLVEKSRDMGASWLIVSLFLWRWMFYPGQSFLMVSRNEEYVDKSGNPKSLFWKVDYLLQRQPAWLLPTFSRSRMHLSNSENGSVIDGESTTGDVARGDRRTAIMLDEFAAFNVDDGYRVLASTADSTNCRFFNSTPQGSANAFYDTRQSGVKRLRMHWSDHPLKSQGLWFDDDGKPRSQWYDNECRRRGDPRLVAQELDINYLGSTFQYFEQTIIDRVLNDDVRSPYACGELKLNRDGRAVGFIDQRGGRLLLWLKLAGDLPPGGRYVMGVDIATGTGSSNSCISVGDARTGEKVAEFTASRLRPEGLARMAVSLARWFDNAFVVWEANGPGNNFGDHLIELGYRHFFYRKNERTIIKRRSGDTPGWYSTKETKLRLMGDYRHALSTGSLVNRSRLAVEECKEYVYADNGSVIHARSKSKRDPTGARDNHGDRVIADALLWRGMKDLHVQRPVEPLKAPAGSLAWRQNESKRRQKQNGARRWSA